MVLHAALGALLTRCGAGEDIVVGTPVAGRTEPALDPLIGLFTNTLVLRADTSGDPAFRDLLARLRTADLAALDHQDLPFDRLVDALNPPRTPGRHPLFQIMLALQNNEPAVLELDGSRTRLRPTATGTAKFDLFVDVLESRTPEGTPDGLTLHVEYATDLYDTGTVEAFAHALREVLRTVGADPGVRVGRLPALPERAPAPSATGLTELEDAARSVPGVHDAQALPGTDGAPPRLYVVPARADAAERVEDALDRAGHGIVRVTAVNALPRTEDGTVDTAELDALPTVDRTAAGTWREGLARIPGVTVAEVTVENAPEELERRHTGLPDRPTGPAPASARPGSASAVPALSEGPALAEPSVPSWADALRRAAERGRGDIVHVHADGSEHRRSYASLIPEASRVLAGLRRTGLRPGDPVILQCDATEDFLAVLWGCLLGGFVAVPLTVPASYDSPSAALTKLEGIWRMLGRPRIVCSAGREAGLRDLAARQDWPGLRLTTADALREAPEDHDWHPARPDDLLLMLMTSGSTGLPKAVRLTHRNVLTRSAATEQLNALGADDVSLNWIPLDHVTGVVMFHLRDVYLGCRQIHAPTSWILEDPLRWMDLADRHRVTVTWAPNFAFGLLAEQSDRFAGRAWDLSPMRLVMNAGEVVVASAARRFLHTLKPFGLPQDVMHPGWGMSETCSVVTDTVLPAEPVPDEGTFVSCGRPYPGFAMRIVDEQGTLLTEGEAGRFQVRGTSVTGGYHDNPEANAEAFTEDGWFDTGDLAYLRGGELYITGRAKDVIIVNGVNHYSHEIEACVEELPFVERSFTAAVAVRSDPSSPTDELALFLHLTEEATAEALREIAGKVTLEIGVSPAFMVPVGRDAIPKTEIGKIQRTRLRKSFEAGTFDEEIRRTQLLLGSAATVPDWFLRPVWQRAERPEVRTTPTGRHTLVLTGADPRVRRLAERLADLLRSGGGLCTVVDEGTAYARLDAAHHRVRPTEEADHAELLRRLEADRRPVDAVLHLDGLRDSRDPETAPQDTTDARELLALARALAARPGRRRPVDLVYVTAGAQAVRPGDRPSPAHAMAGALLKSLTEEFGWLRGTHLDLPPDDGTDPTALLAAEATVTVNGAEVAYRDGHRYVRRLAALPDTPPRAEPATRDGFTLLTGGLGGVGTEIATHLLRTPGTRLLITGRTPESETEGLSRLRELGEVRYARADVTDAHQVRAAVEAAGEAWDAPLTSVLHLAGTLEERPVGELDAATWSRALAAKTRGAWTLHRLTADRPVTSFVTFSSVNGFFGGAMNAAYAAANAYLDALARYRRSLGLPAQSLAWSMWRERGMSRGYGLTALTEARGYRLLDVPAALRSFDLARTLDEPHLLIGADRTAPWVRSHVVAPVRQTRRLTARVGLEDGTDLGALYRAAADAARATGLRDEVWTLCSAGTTAHSDSTETGRSCGGWRAGSPRCGAASSAVTGWAGTTTSSTWAATPCSSSPPGPPSTAPSAPTCRSSTCSPTPPCGTWPATCRPHGRLPDGRRTAGTAGDRRPGPCQGAGTAAARRPRPPFRTARQGPGPCLTARTAACRTPPGREPARRTLRGTPPSRTTTGRSPCRTPPSPERTRHPPCTTPAHRPTRSSPSSPPSPSSAWRAASRRRRPRRLLGEPGRRPGVRTARHRRGVPRRRRRPARPGRPLTDPAGVGRRGHRPLRLRLLRLQPRRGRRRRPAAAAAAGDGVPRPGGRRLPRRRPHGRGVRRLRGRRRQPLLPGPRVPALRRAARLGGARPRGHRQLPGHPRHPPLLRTRPHRPQRLPPDRLLHGARRRPHRLPGPAGPPLRHRTRRGRLPQPLRRTGLPPRARRAVLTRRPLPRLRRGRRRHLLRRRRGSRRAQAPGGRPRRRRPRPRRHPRQRRQQRRPPQGRLQRAQRRRTDRGDPRRTGPGGGRRRHHRSDRGARHRHQARRSDRGVRAHRGVPAQHPTDRVLRARLGQDQHRPPGRRRGHRRTHQGRPRPGTPADPAEPPLRPAQPAHRLRREPLPGPHRPGGVARTRPPPPGRRQRLRDRRHQRPRRPGGGPAHRLRRAPPARGRPPPGPAAVRAHRRRPARPGRRPRPAPRTPPRTAPGRRRPLPAHRPARTAPPPHRHGGHPRGGPRRAALRTARPPPADDPVRVAFLLPGGGTQYPGMGAELYRDHTVYRDTVDECARVLRPVLGADVRTALFEERHPDDTAAFLGLVVTEYALARTLVESGVRPDALIGHSLGEYTAACLAGVIDLDDMLPLVTERIRLISSAGGATVGVAAPAEEIEPLLDDTLSLAAVNGPNACTVAGHLEAVTRFEDRLTRRGVPFRRLRIPVAAHSHVLDPVLPAYETHLGQVTLRPPRLPYVTNVTGTWVTDAQATSVRHWLDHTRNTVRFTDGIAALWDRLHPVLVEIGPGDTLTKLATARLADEAPVTVTTMRHAKADASDGFVLAEALGRLWGAGVDGALPPVPGAPRRVPLPPYAFERRRHWIDAPGARTGTDDAPATEDAVPALAPGPG